MSDSNRKILDAPQRMNLLTGIPKLLAEFGCRTAEAIDGLGVDPTIFDDPENLILYSVAGRLLERCAEVTACQNFGLLLGSRHDHTTLGLPGKLMQNAPDLGTAISEFCALQITDSRGAVVYLHRSGEVFVVGYGIYEPATVGHAQIYALFLAQAANTIRALTGGAVEPLKALLSTSQPADIEPYRSALKVPIRFNQPETGLVFHCSALSAPIAGASPAEFVRIQNRFQAMKPKPGQFWTQRVRHAVRPMLLRGNATTADMAELLGVNLRTLSRRLEAEGATFQRLLEEVRYAMARELLLITGLTVGEIAGALAYTEHSSFTEAFRRWSGSTPTEWRRKKHQT